MRGISELWHSGVALPLAQIRTGPLGQAGKAVANAIELALLELLQVKERVVSSRGRAQQLIQLHLDRFRITVLRVLNQEDHEEGDVTGSWPARLLDCPRSASRCRASWRLRRS